MVLPKLDIHKCGNILESITVTTTFQPVYCDECRWLINNNSMNETHHFIERRCGHKSNIIERHNWFNKWDEYKKSPKKLNKYNNCPNWED